jgi:hypothetical protein
MKSTVAVIDPVISSDFLCGMLKRMGFYTIGLISPNMNRQTLIARLSSKFDKLIFLSGNIDQDITKINRVAPYRISRCIAGAEHDLPYAEKLIFSLTPNQSNDPQTSELRYDKHEAMKKTRNANLGAINEYVLHKNFDEHNQIFNLIKYPCFIKPKNASSGSFGAEICDSKKALISYLENIPDSGDFGFPLDGYIAQDFINGDEYLIDIVSNNGHHEFISLYRYYRFYKNGKPVLKYRILENINSKLILKSFQQVSKILDELDLKNGMSHTEFFIENGKFYFNEVNPRISGSDGYINLVSMFTQSNDQVSKLFNHQEKIKQLYKYAAIYKPDMEIPDTKLLKIASVKNFMDTIKENSLQDILPEKSIIIPMLSNQQLDLESDLKILIQLDGYNNG